MDKYEYNTKIDKIKRHYLKQNYAAAVKLADEIDFKKLKDWKTIALMINLYEAVGRPQDVRYFCVLAYNRNLGGRKLIYKLTKVCLALGEVEEAEDLYEEYSRFTGNDSKKTELKYELRKAQNAGNDELIEILTELGDRDFDDKYGYTLAYLYSKEKQYDKCVEVCDRVIDTFVDGEYVDKAKDLRSFYVGADRVDEPQKTEDKIQLAATKVFRGKETYADPAEDTGGSDIHEEESKPNPAVESARQSVQEIIDNAKKSVENTYEEVKKETEIDDIKVTVPSAKYDTKSLQDTVAKAVSECIDEAAADDVFKINTDEQEAEAVSFETAQDEKVISVPANEDYEDSRMRHDDIEDVPAADNVSGYSESEITGDQEDRLEAVEAYVEEVEVITDEPSVELKSEADTKETVLDGKGDVSVDRDVSEALYMVAAALAEEAEEELKPSVDDVPNNKIAVKREAYAEHKNNSGEYEMPISVRRYFTKYTNIGGLTGQISEFLASVEGNEGDLKMGTSCIGNIIISGNRSSDKKQLAINIIKAVNVIDGDRVRKIATTSGDSINQRGIAKSIGKIAGAALIIEEAGVLEKRRVDELLRVMEGDTDEMLVIIEDSESEINLLLKNNPELERVFNHRIIYKQYNVNELVEMCKRYAEKCNFIIDDKAMFLLYSKINEIHAHEEGVNLEEVRAVIDIAIDRAEKRAGRVLFGGIKKKKVDDKEYYVLVESDFKD